MRKRWMMRRSLNGSPEDSLATKNSWRTKQRDHQHHQPPPPVIDNLIQKTTSPNHLCSIKFLPWSEQNQKTFSCHPHNRLQQLLVRLPLPQDPNTIAPEILARPSRLQE